MDEQSKDAAEVNRLYWQTEESVAEISNRLGLSRRVLYELLEPEAAGITCPNCAAELYFSNRSAKAAGAARCLMCGTERELEDGARESAEGEVSLGDAPATGLATYMGDRTAMIAAAALGGVIVGTAAGLLIRRLR